MEDLNLLLRLQRIDSETMDLKTREEEIPETIRSLEAEMARRGKEIEKEVQRIGEDNKRRGMLELELEIANETVKRYQRQLLDVKTNKEYTALLHEIEGEKDKISKLEEEILTLMDEIECLGRELEASRRDLETRRRSSEEETQHLEGELRDVNDQIAIKEDERKRVVARLKDDLLERYERIRERWGRLAVVALDREVCGGCFATLPPQFVSEVRKGDKVLICEHCGRILVWKEG